MKTPLTFTASGPVYGFAPGVKTGDIVDQLNARQIQLEALLAMTFGDTTAQTTNTEDFTEATGIGEAANLLYVSDSGAGAPFCGITATSTSSAFGVKNYAIGIYDKAGTPWWDVKGGK